MSASGECRVLDLGPGDMLIVGPKGRLHVGRERDGTVIVEIDRVGVATAAGMTRMDPVFRAAVDEFWRNFDDMGESVVSGENAE